MTSTDTQVHFDHGHSVGESRLNPVGKMPCTLHDQLDNADDHQQSDDCEGLDRFDPLERKLQVQKAQLRTALKQADQAKVELQQFVSAVSHDLRAPLRAIAGYSEFLREEYEDQLDETASGYIGRIVNGAARMQKLMSSLTVYSNVLTRGASFAKTNLNEAFENSVANLSDLIDTTGAVLTRDKLPIVWGDSTQLARLMQQLIENGIRFRGIDPPLIHVTAKHTGTDWTLEVSDNGIGIEEQHQSCVFEMYRRLQIQQDDFGKDELGTGAGLAICRRIVERHQGEIWLESKPDQGTTIYFTIASGK